MTFDASLDVSGRLVVCCGGGPAALGTISRLLAEGAQVRVVATEVATAVRDLADREQLAWQQRKVASTDLAGAALVLASAGDADVRDAAATLGVPVATLPDQAGFPDSTDATDRPLPGQGGPGTGKVILLGGGPGDPGLLTVAGLAAIRAADVIICDRLAPLAALEHARADALVIDVAKIPRGEFTSQQRINRLLVEHASLGQLVVRFKGGDSFVFGRGGEEWQACAAAGVAVEVIPGVSSATAAPALAGIPLTHRTMTQGFTVVSGHLPPGDPGSTLDWAVLARTNTTLVILMGVATLAAITTALIASGLPGDTPAATVADAGRSGQRTVRGVVSDIAERTRQARIQPPAITVIGAVAGFDPLAP